MTAAEGTNDTPMRVVSLNVNNVLRVEAVRVDPDPDDPLVIIAGNNASGKTSVLEAMWLALGGRAASSKVSMPIRTGEDRASVEVDLGSIVVTREWDASKSTPSKLIVRSDGHSLSSPQALLDALVGHMAFDPVEFCRLTSRQQVEALLQVVDIELDLDEHDRQYDDLYERRRVTKSKRDDAAAQLAAVAEPDPGLPAEPIVYGEVLVQLRQMQEVATHNARMRQAAAEAAERLAAAGATVRRLEEELAAARTIEREAAHVASEASAEAAELEDPDLGAVEALLADIEQTNDLIRDAAEYRRRKADLDRLEGEVGDLELLVHENLARRNQALRDATMPVEGLTFDREGVFFRDVPFAQASSAEQIRVALGIAMAANPKLRVVRIADGSLLDQASLSVVRDMAAEHDYQVWLERVGQDPDATVIIEDGRVQSG